MNYLALNQFAMFPSSISVGNVASETQTNRYLSFSLLTYICMCTIFTSSDNYRAAETGVLKYTQYATRAAFRCALSASRALDLELICLAFNGSAVRKLRERADR